MVYVLDVNKKPLMPTSRHSKVAYLLKSGKAKVVTRTPFTIQLLEPSKSYVQSITLGQDTGYANIAVSAVTEKKELFSATYKLDNRITSHLQDRAQNRKYRRYRLRYRKQRNLNKKIPKGWLPPSISHRLERHVKLIEYVKTLLPIKNIVIEIANFDIKKITQEDQAAVLRTNNQTFNNLISYLVSREQGKCQFCKKVLGNDTWTNIMIDPNGTPVSTNQALVHAACKVKIETGKLYKKIQKSKQYPAETFMNTIRWRLLDRVEGASYTFGYVTYEKRNEYKLDKEHNTDAFIIAGGSTQERSKHYTAYYYRRHNRQLQLNRKGFAPAIRRTKYKLRPGDLVRSQSKVYTVKGVHSYGKRVNIFDDDDKVITKQIHDVKLIRYAKTMTFTEE